MRMGYPSMKDIVNGINKGRVLNLPISKSDLDNAVQIWVRGWKNPTPVVIEPTRISLDKEAILCACIFYIGGLTCLMSVSQKINMCVVSYLANRKISKLQYIIMNTSPYKLTDLMAIQLIFYECMMINMFPKTK